ncbi:MAG: preprotein translocase subunit SecE [Lachnospiraceae bacterium]
MGDSKNTENTPKISFWKGVKAEFKKISWPDKTQIFKQSVAVICISIVLGFIIMLLDTVLQYGVNLLTM